MICARPARFPARAIQRPGTRKNRPNSGNPTRNKIGASEIGVPLLDERRVAGVLAPLGPGACVAEDEGAGDCGVLAPGELGADPFEAGVGDGDIIDPDTMIVVANVIQTAANPANRRPNTTIGLTRRANPSGLGRSLHSSVSPGVS